MSSLQGMSSSPIQGIDHVLYCTPNPEELFACLTRELSFPVAWPFKRYKGFASDGVFMGNMNLELIRFEEILSDDQKAEYHLDNPRFCAIALKPVHLKATHQFLQSRGIPHRDPQDFYTTILRFLPFKLCINITVERLLAWNEFAFVCGYTFSRLVDRHWSSKRHVLEKNGGGAWSFKRINRVIVFTRNEEQQLKNWYFLIWDRMENIDLSSKVRHLFMFPSGHRIQFNMTESDEGIQRLELDVLDLTRAHRFLKEKGYVGSADGSSVTIRPERLQGMQLVCRETVARDEERAKTTGESYSSKPC